MNRVARRWLRRPWFATLLITALLFRFLVPVGYMPGVGSDGAFTVMLCPGYAPVVAGGMGGMSMPDMSGMDGMADMPGMEHAGGHSPHDPQGNCPYAAAAAGGTLPLHVSISVAAQAPPYAPFFRPDEFIPRGTIVPTRLPRGPPART